MGERLTVLFDNFKQLLCSLVERISLFAAIKGEIFFLLGILLTVFIAIWALFKGTKRLIYSTSSKNVIKDDLRQIEKLTFNYNNTRIDNLNISDVLIYNNGYKTVGKDDVEDLKIIAENGRVFDVMEIYNHGHSSLNLNEESVFVNIDKFDKNNLYVFRVFHEGNIKVSGRVLESGEIMNTEAKYWGVVYLITLLIWLPSAAMTASWIMSIPPNDPYYWLYEWSAVCFIFMSLILFLLRRIHGMFFIPDSLSNKYLKSK